MAEGYDYADINKSVLEEVETEKFSNPYEYNSSELYLWESFMSDLKSGEIKIKKKTGWLFNYTQKDDINYTFDLYKRSKYGTNFMKGREDKEKEKRTFLRISEKFKGDEIITHKEFLDNRIQFQYLLDEETNNDYYPFLKIFSNLLYSGEIKILKKPKQRGWIYDSRSNLEDDLKYTLKKYYDNFPKYFLEDTQKNEPERPIIETPVIMNSKKRFIKNNPKLLDIYKKFVVENDEQLNNILRDQLLVKNLPENEVYDILIEEAERKYNFENDKNNENIRKFSSLSAGMKEKVKNESKRLDEFLKELKPFVEEYNARNKARDESFRKKVLENEEAQKKKDIENQRKKYEEQIEDLEYKISDANSKYSMNRAKLRKLDSRLKNLKPLEKRKTELEQKLREKNLKIQERQKLLQEKTELNEKLKNLQNLEDQLADLKSRIPDTSIFEQEKILRERELRKLKNLNNSSIREKNALFRSIELEKIKREIAIREEERYQQELRQKEELKQAKIIFLKEKKIAQEKIDDANISRKKLNEQATKMKELEQDYLSQKKFLEEIKAMKESRLKEKKLQIEQKKLKTLEIEKQTLEKKQDYAEQQKLFADSIKRDIDDLNDQKDILTNLRKNNEKILQNTKDELKKRQEEIEKTIKLNLENLKTREANILSEESKIKLDVFYTLKDVKEQTAQKLELEKKLQDLKDEIIRKQEVSDLLNETVEKISNNEILEAEEYNAFLDSEISFKKKLESIQTNQKQVLEVLTEEKQTYLEFLKDAKSQYLQDLLNTKRDIIEKNIRITLIEGKENLSYVTSGLKFEIEKLQKEKEILQRRRDLVNFQQENYKKELNLRNQELELLKKIRIKALDNERKIIRNEARSAISDMVKSIEKTERDADVREKLDEMLDYTENKEISRKSKAALFSLIDKIEDKEIHEAAKEKLDFILGKIELHDNIDESKKALDKILDKIENKQIRQDVEEKIDEILDDVELEDYDFLDEEDDFDNFLSNVRKHISGEKRMEQFNKIDKIFEEAKETDFKLKMDENIEMKKIGPEDYEQGEGSQETAFDEFSDYNFFIQNIEDPVLKEKTRTFLGNVDSFDKEEEKIPKLKNAYKSAINDALWKDELDLNYWEGSVIKDERAKFDYEQKVNNINNAFAGDYDIHIDPTDLKIREFLDIKLTNSFSEKRGEINGYIYEGEKIISRSVNRFFYFEKIKKVEKTEKFIGELRAVINNTARSQIANESLFEGEKATRDCAREYIFELREEQSYQVDSAKNSKEMRDALRNANEIDSEIKNIKKNLPFKMRLKIFKRTLSWRITKLLRLLWKHKKIAGGVLFTIISATIGILLNQLGVVEVVHNLKKAAASVKQYADDVHEMGKRIMKTVQSLYRVPGTFIGYLLILSGLFIRTLYYLSYFSSGAGASWIFGILGVCIEIALYFDTNVEIINEKAADILEETGNIIENAGIRSQKYISKNMPRWYYDKPKEERTILETLEAGAIKAVYKVAEGTQSTGETIHETANFMRESYYYMKVTLILFITIIILIILRDLSSLTIIKNGTKTKKSASKRRKKT